MTLTKPPRVRNGLYPLDSVDKLEEATMPKVESWMSKKNSTCTMENASIRREWYVETFGQPIHELTPNRSDLSVPEREDYIKAVLCLQSKPAKVPKSIAPGAKSRFDDFVAFHMWVWELWLAQPISPWVHG